MKRFQFFTLALLVSMTMPAVAEPLAYVPNEKSATISIIDTANDQHRGQIPAGVRPRGIAAGANHLYLTDGKTGSLLIVDTLAGKLARSVRVEIGRAHV